MIAIGGRKHQNVASLYCVACFDTSYTRIRSKQVIGRCPDVAMVVSIGRQNIPLQLDHLSKNLIVQRVAGQFHKIKGSCVIKVWLALRRLAWLRRWA